MDRQTAENKIRELHELWSDNMSMFLFSVRVEFPQFDDQRSGLILMKLFYAMGGQ